MTKLGEFKGNKTITLIRDANDRWPFSFGVGKAKLIIENFEEIVAFVEANDKPAVPTTPVK